MSDEDRHVYDKAKYHSQSVHEHGLPEEHAYNHTTFFMSWLIKNGLMSSWFEEEAKAELQQFRNGTLTVNKLYEYWDGCFISDMLSNDGNAFARAYFDFENGKYLADYCKCLQKALPSEFHVPYTEANEALIHNVISQRYQEWLSAK
jgi:hypothetical protein